MALGFTDWSGYTLNARPSDWTLRGGDSSYGIVREASGQRYLDLLITNTGRNLLTWDLLDTAPGTDEIDVYVVYRRPAVSQGGEFSAQVGVRGSGSASTIEAYILGPRSTQPYPGSEYLRAGRYTNGGNFTILSDYETNTLSDTWYCSRIRISGTSIKMRRWLEGDPEPSTWDNETTDSVISGEGWVGLFGFNDSETHVKAFGVGTNGDPAPTGPVGPGGDEQDVTLVSGQQITQTMAVDVNQVAAINAIVASQQTQSQAAPVQQVAALSSIDGQQATEAEQGGVALTALLGAVEAQQVTQAVSVEISTAAVMDITAVLLEQVTQAQTVTVDHVAQAAAVIAQQLTQGAPLSTEQVADLATVVVEQITQAQAVDVSIVRPDDLTVAVIEQLTQAQSIPTSQSAQVTGVSAESRTQAQAATVAAEYSLVAVTSEQITQAQAVEILDGTGLNVVTLEQATQAQAATVTLLALVNGIPAETRQEASTIATAATMLVTANEAQQLTEADIADILGSAMQLDPRELTITRTTAGFHVQRTTPTYRLQFKHSIH